MPRSVPSRALRGQGVGRPDVAAGGLPGHLGAGDEAEGVLPVGRQRVRGGQHGEREVVLAREPSGDRGAGDVPVGAGRGEEGVVVARDGDAEDVALVGEDGGRGGGRDPGVAAGPLGVHERHAVADGGPEGAGAVRPVGGDRPVGPGVGLGVRGVQAGEADGEVGLVGVLVLPAVPDDRGRGRVADLQAGGLGLVGERVPVHGGGVRVVAVALEGERGPPVVGGDRVVPGGGGDLGGDRGAGVGRRALGAGGAGVGVAAGTRGDGGGGRGGGGGAQGDGGQGDGEQGRRGGPDTGPEGGSGPGTGSGSASGDESGEGGSHEQHLDHGGRRARSRALSSAKERKTPET